MLLGTLGMISCAALNLNLKVGRRAALGSAASLSLTFVRPPLAAHAATPIEKGAPAFGTAESRTGLLDGIKSAFSEKTGEELALEYGRSPADVSGVTAALPPAFAKARDVAIIFHGSGGPDRETEAVLARFRAQDPRPHPNPSSDPNPHANANANPIANPTRTRTRTRTHTRTRTQDAAAGLSREVIVFNWMPWFTANTDRPSFQRP